MAKYLTKAENETRLEDHVRNWINNHTKNNQYYSWKEVCKDLFYGGCNSGIVGHLIYSVDCYRFVKNYIEEIIELIAEWEDNTGEPFFANKNISMDLLAWSGLELAAQKIADENGYDD